VHRAFAEAGAQMVLAGTFRLLPGVADDWERRAHLAVALARSAGVATWASLGPTGRADDPAPWATAARALRDRVDGFYLETFVDPRELLVAARAVAPHGRVVASLVPADDGRTRAGEAIGPWLDRIAATGAEVGLNCAPPDAVRRAAAAARGRPLWLKASGSPVSAPAAVAVGGCCGVSPEALADFHRGAG
jgi:methionine synthase I (cobalamin-dependent)